ncbi:alpha/beta fold hydrolase [Leptobacterium flavescens]|uniref:Alpha/beta fold hydrolase n=1 Tax=Leptobacterium flavescens TaxID=472055 RepID=A0A6P0UM23_9FLAO|nr:alpha/beta hydrolase [Leptobacterium flavescens]NER14284.1 alpha/beta fold hydrolase [Leptobacterium flavescens]
MRQKRRKIIPRKLKIALRFIALFILISSHQSCFRFRMSDKKSMELFKQYQVNNSIDYFQPSNTDYKVRVVSTSANKPMDTAVFFIHGAPGAADGYYEYLKDSALLERAALYTIDRPGYGYSRFGKAVTSIEEQTRIVAEIIESLEQENVIVVGHSFGGPIAAYSSLKSDKVKAVLMLAPAIDPENEKVFWFAYVAKWRLTKWMVPGALGVAGDEKFTHVKELKKIRDNWMNVRVPVVHIHGTKDVVVPFDNVSFTKENFNQDYLRVIELEGENHFLPWARKELVTREILKLLQAGVQ